jgi:hypothetical protein
VAATDTTQSLAQPPIAIRGCDGCTLCCKVMAVRELPKPAGTWCQHCKAGTGCGIYDGRPAECRTFMCGYLQLPALSEAWKPSASRLIVSSELMENRINIHVDPGRPDAWRREPFYAEIKQWSRRITPERGQVVVMIGERSIVILPDHDVDLGVLAPGELLVVSQDIGRGGFAYEAYAVSGDVEVGRKIDAAKGKPVSVPVGGEGFRKGRVVG